MFVGVQRARRLAHRGEELVAFGLEGRLEHGRHRLAGPLGALLAVAVARAAPAGAPVRLLPVPSTASAARERHGDHMARLATHAVRRLRAAGWAGKRAAW